MHDQSDEICSDVLYFSSFIGNDVFLILGIRKSELLVEVVLHTI